MVHFNLINFYMNFLLNELQKQLVIDTRKLILKIKKKTFRAMVHAKLGADDCGPRPGRQN